MPNYEYELIAVNLKSDNSKCTYTENYCDYYILDGFLTVFREEAFYVGSNRYLPFSMHFPVDDVARIKCVKKG